MPEAYCVECDRITSAESKCRLCETILCKRHLLEGMICPECKKKKSKTMPFFFSREESLWLEIDGKECKLRMKDIEINNDPDISGETIAVVTYTTASQAQMSATKKKTEDPF